ncbi:MAG: 50S ribosomal protein L15 [Bacteroidales bacterium]|nr:50S ribosomal protein L15 [Bacteroidales bacterium]MBS3773851.1 50S ribosomal protein L15 [Bacteroidales bacterium]
MDLSNIKPAPNSSKSKTRKGRGQGSGKGGSSTRGKEGQKSRRGYSRKLGFEGGQMPLYRRIPKFGFKNINRKEYKAVNLEALEKLAEEKNLEKIDLDAIYNNGLVKKGNLVKILGKGKLTKKLEVHAHAFSNSAREAIESVEGTAVKL